MHRLFSGLQHRFLVGWDTTSSRHNRRQDRGKQRSLSAQSPCWRMKLPFSRDARAETDVDSSTPTMSKHTSLALACLLSLSLGVPAFRNGVGQLPVMGWSGYLAFMQNSGHCDQAGASGYNETTFVQTMDALRATGLADAGYVYLNADDCWIAENRTQDGRLTHDTSRFPHGMAWLADQAHSRALKLGLCKPASNATPEASRDGIRTRVCHHV